MIYLTKIKLGGKMEIIYAEEKSFNDHIASGVSLVDFYADWCGPCKMISPELDILKDKLGEGQKIIKVNVDDQSAIASEYGVMSIPTLIKFKDGQKVDQKVGVISADDMKKWMDEN